MTGSAEEPTQARLVRPADLADLRFGFLGLSFKRPAVRRILVRTALERDGLIVVTFPAQHVVEQTFFESAGTGLPDPVPVQLHLPPPVVSRIGGRSTLVFVVGPDDEVPYTAEGLLEAMGRLPLRTSTSTSARPGGSRPTSRTCAWPWPVTSRTPWPGWSCRPSCRPSSPSWYHAVRSRSKRRPTGGSASRSWGPPPPPSWARRPVPTFPRSRPVTASPRPSSGGPSRATKISIGRTPRSRPN